MPQRCCERTNFTIVMDRMSSPRARLQCSRTPALTKFRIVRDDSEEDAITRMRFASYDEAYDELERFYAGLCCSDDRVEYSIETVGSIL